MKTSWLAVAVALAVAGCGVGVEDGDSTVGATQQELVNPDVRPTGRGGGIVNNFAKPGSGGTSNGIVYHGGPVMLGTTTVYYIWYGNWSGNTATSILTDFAQNVGGSPYYNINTTYYDGTNAINSNALPKNANAVYFVLTSADVTASSGFCTQYCGWHTHGTIAGTDIKYSFVGNPDRCPSSCAAQTTGPNGNAGADGMASILAHELEEAVTDPDLNAWYDRRGYENADKCAWTFGTTYTVANGAKANMKLGARDFYIQQNWVNAAGGYCATAY
jgi:hypothetical protein